jgi:polysaccharide biosynthesis transport protein
LDLRRQIAIIRAWLPLLVASVVLAAGAAFLVSSQLPKTYEAKVKLMVGQSLSAADPDYTQILVSQRLATTYASIATNRPMLEAVIKQLGISMTPDELSRRIRVSVPVDSTELVISTQDGDPTRAADISNALAEQLVLASSETKGRQAEIQTFIDSSLRDTQAQIVSTQARIDALNALPTRTAKEDADLVSLEGSLATLRSTFATLLSFFSGTASNVLTVSDPATVPVDPISPKVFLYTLLAAVVGLLLAGSIMALATHLDDKIRDSDAVLEVAGLSTLGTIGRMRGGKERKEMYRLAAILYPRSGDAEAYRALRTNIEFSSVDTPMRTLLVTSSMPGEGKTVTAANLAVVFAQTGRRVLLVDADLRKPGVHIVFDLPNTHGLTTLLRSDDVSLDAIAQTTEQENLRILTTGPLPPNPAELMGTQRMRALLERMKNAADIIIVDSPPLQAVTDSAILSSFLDGTLLVIDAEHSRPRAVRLARETLGKAGANVLGAVLNRIAARARSDYADYYGDYYASAEATKAPAGRTTDPSSDAPGPSAHLPGTS